MSDLAVHSEDFSRITAQNIFHFRTDGLSSQTVAPQTSSAVDKHEPYHLSILQNNKGTFGLA